MNTLTGRSGRPLSLFQAIDQLPKEKEAKEVQHNWYTRKVPKECKFGDCGHLVCNYSFTKD